VRADGTNTLIFTPIFQRTIRFFSPSSVGTAD
jgi:hypothetical protein